MILVRHVFRVKMGRADEALARWREILGSAQRAQAGATSMNLLTDLVGAGNTIVLESTFDDLAAYERSLIRLTRDSSWRESYDRFEPLAESAYREIFTIVSE